MDEKRESLKRKLMLRSSVDDLVERGIYPSLRIPVVFAGQQRQLERAKTGDMLRHKLQQRPGRKELVQHRILDPDTDSLDPSLVGRHRDLKRACLVDGLNDKLAHRPGPLELVQGNILQPTDELSDAIKDGTLVFSKTISEANSFVASDGSSSNGEDSSPPSIDNLCSAVICSPASTPPLFSGLQICLSKKSVNITSTGVGASTEPVLTPPASLFSGCVSNVFSSGPSPLLSSRFNQFQARSQSVSTQSTLSGHLSNAIGGVGKVRSKKSKQKVSTASKVIKFHEYKGPPNAVKFGSCDGGGCPNRKAGTPYHILLQQQQLFLQWQLEFKRKQSNLRQSMVTPSFSTISNVGQSSFTKCQTLISASHQFPVYSSIPTMLQTQFFSTATKTTLNSQHSICLPSLLISSAGLPLTSIPLSIPMCQSDCLPKSAVVQPVPSQGTKANPVSLVALSMPKITTNISEMKVADLRLELKKRNLPVSGSKPQLIDRLRPYTEESAGGLPVKSDFANRPHSLQIFNHADVRTDPHNMDLDAAVQRLCQMPSFLSSPLNVKHFKDEPMSACDTLSAPPSPLMTDGSTTPLCSGLVSVNSPTSRCDSGSCFSHCGRHTTGCFVAASLAPFDKLKCSSTSWQRSIHNEAVSMDSMDLDSVPSNLLSFSSSDLSVDFVGINVGPKTLQCQNIGSKASSQKISSAIRAYSQQAMLEAFPLTCHPINSHAPLAPLLYPERPVEHAQPVLTAFDESNAHQISTHYVTPHVSASVFHSLGVNTVLAMMCGAPCTTSVSVPVSSGDVLKLQSEQIAKLQRQLQESQFSLHLHMLQQQQVVLNHPQQLQAVQSGSVTPVNGHAVADCTSLLFCGPENFQTFLDSCSFSKGQSECGIVSTDHTTCTAWTSTVRSSIGSLDEGCLSLCSASVNPVRNSRSLAMTGSTQGCCSVATVGTNTVSKMSGASSKLFRKNELAGWIDRCSLLSNPFSSSAGDPMPRFLPLVSALPANVAHSTKDSSTDLQWHHFSGQLSIDQSNASNLSSGSLAFSPINSVSFSNTLQMFSRAPLSAGVSLTACQAQYSSSFCLTHPFYNVALKLAPPPGYEEAVRDRHSKQDGYGLTNARLDPFLHDSNVMCEHGDGPGCKCQDMDDILEILMHNGDLPVFMAGDSFASCAPPTESITISKASPIRTLPCFGRADQFPPSARSAIITTSPSTLTGASFATTPPTGAECGDGCGSTAAGVNDRQSQTDRRFFGKDGVMPPIGTSGFQASSVMSIGGAPSQSHTGMDFTYEAISPMSFDDLPTSPIGSAMDGMCDVCPVDNLQRCVLEMESDDCSGNSALTMSTDRHDSYFSNDLLDLHEMMSGEFGGVEWASDTRPADQSAAALLLDPSDSWWQITGAVPGMGSSQANKADVSPHGAPCRTTLSSVTSLHPPPTINGQVAQSGSGIYGGTFDWLDVVVPRSCVVSVPMISPGSVFRDPVLTPKAHEEVLNLFNFDAEVAGSDNGSVGGSLHLPWDNGCEEVPCHD